MHLVDDWIENYLSYERFSRVKRKEKVSKKETVFKVKYDPVTGKTQVKESKHSKALRQAATQYIKKFEKEYPEYFTEDFFEKTQSKLKRFSEKEASFGREEIPKVHEKYSDLKKIIKGEEEEELIQKAYILYSFFIFSDRALSKKDIYDRWKSIFTLSTSARKLIDEMVNNPQEFTKTQSEKYKLNEKTIIAVSQDSDFKEFLNYIDQVINGPAINEEEIQNEEQLAENQEVERNQYIKEFSQLPLKSMRSLADVTKMLQENLQGEELKKWKITAEDNQGKLVPIPDEKYSEDDYQYNVEVKKSTIAQSGDGLFATEEFSTGERIAKYSGEILTEEEFNERYGEHELAAYTVPITITRNGTDYTFYIDAKNTKTDLGRYSNDYRGSKRGKPNAEIVYDQGSDVWEESQSGAEGRPVLKAVNVWLEATDNINEGEEIFIDYGEDYWKESEMKISEPKIQPITSQTSKKEETITPEQVVMQRFFDYTPKKTISSKEIDIQYHSNEFESVKDSLIQSSVPFLVKEFKSKNPNPSYLTISLLDNIRNAKIKQLEQHENLDLLLRSAFVMYTTQGKKFMQDITPRDKQKIQEYIQKVLEIVPNSQLAPLDIKTNKKSVEELRKMLYSIVEHGIEDEKKILNRPFKEYSSNPEYKMFSQTPPPNRMDIIKTYESIVKKLNYNSSEYKEDISKIIDNFNSTGSKSLPEIENTAWSIAQVPLY
jgi:hypothetical protein